MTDFKRTVEDVFTRMQREEDEEMERRRIRNEAEGPIRLLSFSMSDEESRKYKRWYDEHYLSCVYLNYSLAKQRGCPTAAIGGAVTFQFTPTSVGTVSSAKCACGAKVDCTDYDGW